MHKETVRHSYSFACLDCGYGWEATYDVDVAVDESARITVRYRLDGRHVPSPLQSPRCPACEGHTIRTLRPGRVATARAYEK